MVKNLNEPEIKIQGCLTNKNWDTVCPIYTSFKFKQASVMLMLKNHLSSIDVLLSVSNHERHYCCSCNIITISLSDSKTLGQTNIAVTELLCNYLQPCIVYLPLEKEITPTAINYEMIRSFSLPPLLSEYKRRVTYKWGVVNGTFLKHFLLYLNSWTTLSSK